MTEIFECLKWFALAMAVYFYWPEEWIDLTNPAPFYTESELIDIAQSLSTSYDKLTIHYDSDQANLGRKLFFDPRFSANQQVSCATCHNPRFSFTDQKKLAVGQSIGNRNTPTLINVFAADWLFWDGRSDSIESQAVQPLENPKEHGISRGLVSQLVVKHYRLEYEAIYGPIDPLLIQYLESQTESWHAIPDREKHRSTKSLDLALSSYGIATIGDSATQSQLIHEAHKRQRAPQEWFGEKFLLNEDSNTDGTWVQNYQQLDPHLRLEIDKILRNTARSLASYQRGLVAIDSPFDRFVSRLPQSEKVSDAFDSEFGLKEWLGFQRFVESQCTNCHNGPFFTDHQFHNIGLPYLDNLDLGRAKGLILAREDQFRCMAQENLDINNEACREGHYLDDANFETMGAFKTPTLRNLNQTSPYMHDGRFASLDEVLRHYNELSEEPAIGHRAESILPLKHKKESLEELKAFLESLQSDVMDLGSQTIREARLKEINLE